MLVFSVINFPGDEDNAQIACLPSALRVLHDRVDHVLRQEWLQEAEHLRVVPHGFQDIGVGDVLLGLFRLALVILEYVTESAADGVGLSRFEDCCGTTIGKRPDTCATRLFDPCRHCYGKPGLAWAYR